MQLYPYQLAADDHPYSWTLYGFGLERAQTNQIAKHIFDDLGARFTVPAEPHDVHLSWAVDWPLDTGDRRVCHVGDSIDELVGNGTTAIRVINGALPPGLSLERHTSRLRGTLRTAGLYSATVRCFPTIKYDPLGSAGGANSVGKWVPVDQPRHIPDAAPEPTRTLADMSPQELEELIVQAQAAQRAGIIQAAEMSSGN